MPRTLKKSLSIVKLRSFQNASIEIKHIRFVYQQNLFPVTKLICEMQKENIFSNERFFFYSEKKSSNYVRIAFLD